MSVKNVKVNSRSFKRPEKLAAFARLNKVIPTRKKLAGAELNPQLVKVLRTQSVATGKTFQKAGKIVKARPLVVDKLAALEIDFSHLKINQPVEKRLLNVPVSADGTITDSRIYAHAREDGKKYFIPRYGIAVKTVSGRQQYQVHLAQTKQGGELTLDLAAYPADAIKDKAARAEPLEASIAIVLQYRVGGITKEIPFSELKENEGGLTATLRTTSLDEFSQFYQALTDDDYQAELIAKQTVVIAVPYNLKRQRIPVKKVKRVVRKSGSGLFIKRRRVITQKINPLPFVFAKDLHGYIFAGLSNVTLEKKGYIRRQVQYEGEWHSYYQDEVEPETFYYLPDCFKLGRSPEAPFYPLMSISFESEDSSIENTQVHIQYVALPSIDTGRLEQAADALEKFLPEANKAEREEVSFSPLISSDVEYKLLLPRAAGAHNALEDRSEALIDLRTGINDHITLSYKQFQTVYDALFGGVSVLLKGDLTIRFGEGEGAMTEIVSLAIRMNDLEGELFDYYEVKNPAGTGIQATLTNAIESAVRIEELPVTLFIDGVANAANYRSLSIAREASEDNEPTFPVDMNPGDKLFADIVTTASMKEDALVDAVFDLDKVTVKPTAEGVWNVIVDASVPAEYKRKIRISALPDWFEASAVQSDTQIRVILVEFEKGGTVQLDPGNLSAEAEIRLPLKDMILHNLDEGAYRYKVTLILQKGRKKHQNWVTETIEILFPELPE